MLDGRKYLAIGFDMDNTLLRTDVNYPKLSKVAYCEMKMAGVPDCAISEKETYRFNLENGVDYLKKNGRTDDVNKVLKQIRERLKEIEMENVKTARPFEGAVDMLMYLKSKGYLVGVLTKGSRAYAIKALTVSGVIDMLDVLVCRDDHDESETKPSPIAMMHLADSLNVELKDILYIGDHKIDYICARDSGADFIGVLSRYTKEEWDLIGNDIYVTDTVADLMKIL